MLKKTPIGSYIIKTFFTGLIIKAKLTSRHPDNTLAGGSESKRLVDWPRILLAIIVTFGHCNAISKFTSKDCNVSLLSKTRI